MPAPIPPPFGQVQPGELYVDLQTRTLWLGVSDTVSLDQAVLISNIEGADDLAAATLVQANAYTSSKLVGDSGLPIDPNGYSAIGHKHIAADVTNFVPAVEAVIAGSPSAGNFTRGMIMMWSGMLAEIGVGSLAGWALCDGSLGTPNLRDRFILGAGGGKQPGFISPANPLLVGGGSHIHTISAHALTLAEMPAHNHGGATGVEVNKHTHPISLLTDQQGSHQHVGLNPDGSNSDSAEGGPYISTNSGGHINVQSSPASTTAFAGLHQHNVAGNTGLDGVDHTHTIPQDGGGQGHTHTIIGGGGVHEHSVPQTTLRDAIPYVALAYIMKL